MNRHLTARALARAIVIVASGIGWAAPAYACASCGCTLSADWLSQGLAAQPGTTLTLRYDYIPQTVLRSGTDRIAAANLALPNEREIERYTYNHQWTLGLDHQFASDWGIDAQLPILLRPHSTIAEDTVEPSHSRTHGMGDLRLMARWQGLSTPGSITGIEGGLVLPTGAFRQTFDSGPARGEPVDRGLQPGTGTVQAVLGAYHLGSISPDLGYFVQLSGQTAVDRRADYAPGTFAQLSGALSYTRWRGVTPQLQLTLRVVARDRGAAADRANSGGEQVNLAPGATVKLTSRAAAFGFVELPLYSRVNGYQLAPRAKLSIGVRFGL